MATTAASSTCELVVPGLCCVECSLGVVTALRRAAGVHDVRVLGTAEKALVTYDASMIDEASLVHVVEQAGHPVQAWRPLPASRSGTASHRVLPVIALPEREQHQLAAGPSTLAGQQATQTGRKVGFAALRLAFVGLVALIALGEIAAESLGLSMAWRNWCLHHWRWLPWPLAAPPSSGAPSSGYAHGRSILTWS